MLVNSNETPMFNHFTQSVPATALPHYQTPNQGYNLNSPFFTTNNFPNNSLALFNKFPTTYHRVLINSICIQATNSYKNNINNNIMVLYRRTTNYNLNKSSSNKSPLYISNVSPIYSLTNREICFLEKNLHNFSFARIAAKSKHLRNNSPEYTEQYDLII